MKTTLIKKHIGSVKIANKILEKLVKKETNTETHFIAYCYNGTNKVLLTTKFKDLNELGSWLEGMGYSSGKLTNAMSEYYDNAQTPNITKGIIRV